MLIIQQVLHPIYVHYLESQMDSPIHSRQQILENLGIPPYELAKVHPEATLLKVETRQFFLGIQALQNLEFWAKGKSTSPHEIQYNDICAIAALQETRHGETRRYFEVYGENGQSLMEIHVQNLNRYDWWVILQQWADPLQDWPRIEKAKGNLHA